MMASIYCRTEEWQRLNSRSGSSSSSSSDVSLLGESDGKGDRRALLPTSDWIGDEGGDGMYPARNRYFLLLHSIIIGAICTIIPRLYRKIELFLRST
jgi:hypothetical protein